MTDSSFPGRNPLVVLGIHRSGTSTLTNVLRALGFYLGAERDFFASDVNNSAGYFELRDLINLNQKALASFYLAHDRVNVLPPSWQDHPTTFGFEQEASKLLKRHFSGQPYWGWKEPSTTLLLPLYEKVLANLDLDPIYVICVRNPLEVAASQEAWKDVKAQSVAAPLGDRAFGLWVHFTLYALHQTIGKKRALILYDQLLENPQKAVTPIIEAAGKPLDPEDWEAACGTIQPSLRRNRASLEDLEKLPSLLQNTFRLCLDMAEQTSKFNTGGFDEQIKALWNEYLQFRSYFVEPAAPSGVASISTENRSTDHAQFTPNGSWQEISFKVATSPQTRAIVSLYQFPAIAWVRNAKWVKGGQETPAQWEPLIKEYGSSVGDALRLVILPGAPHLVLQGPAEEGSYTFKFELRLEMNEFTSVEAALTAGKTSARLQAEVVGLRNSAADMETRYAQATKELRALKS